MTMGSIGVTGSVSTTPANFAVTTAVPWASKQIWLSGFSNNTVTSNRISSVYFDSTTNASNWTLNVGGYTTSGTNNNFSYTIFYTTR